VRGLAPEMPSAQGCDAMITHRLPLDSYAGAIDTFRQGAGLKVQVRPGGAG
jgi:hypothetical protein